MKEIGYQTWFDKEQLVGDTNVQMSQGIEQKKYLLVFITKWYHDKIEREIANDNCRYEFVYAIKMKTIANMEV